MNENLAPWPYLNQKHAARLLGVDFEFLRVLEHEKRVRYVKTTGKSGAEVGLYNREDIDALCQMIGRKSSTPGPKP